MKLLIADDEATGRALLQRWVSSWGYEPVLVSDGEQAMHALRADSTIQLAVVDWVMPGLTGPEICALLRKDFLEHYVYVVLLTGKSDTEDAVLGLDAGADDYVRKPFDPRELRARLRAGTRLVELHSALTLAKERLYHEASHDSLTGLLNRKAILEELDRELTRARRSQETVSVLMCDVDHFKRVNDSWGHAVGDEVLREIPARVNSGLRSYDRAGRYGGEEFLVVLSNCPEQAAVTVAERVRQAVNGRPFSCGGMELPVSVSCGVASSQRGGFDAHGLMRAADAALYRSKHEGRNRVSRATDAEYVTSRR
jgi:diguanylate cyclase (GGDEF)-like protein